MLPKSLTPEVIEKLKFLLETKRELEHERAYAMDLVGKVLWVQKRSNDYVISKNDNSLRADTF